MPRPKSIRLLGIDPGIARTGYAILESQQGKLRPIAYGCITTKTTYTHPERLVWLAESLTRIIKQHRPHQAALEKLFFAKNAKTAIAVGEARGVILMTLAQHALPLQEFTPQQVKIAVTGYGKADKQQVQRMVKLLLHLQTTPKPDDTADAIAVAVAGLSVPLTLRESTTPHGSAH